MSRWVEVVRLTLAQVIVLVVKFSIFLLYFSYFNLTYHWCLGRLNHTHRSTPVSFQDPVGGGLLQLFIESIRRAEYLRAWSSLLLGLALGFNWNKIGILKFLTLLFGHWNIDVLDINCVSVVAYVLRCIFIWVHLKFFWLSLRAQSRWRYLRILL